MDDVKVKKNKNSEIILASCIRVPRRRKEFVHPQTYTNKQTHTYTYLIFSRIFTMSLENLSLSSLITTIDDEKKERNASRALMMKRKLG